MECNKDIMGINNSVIDYIIHSYILKLIISLCTPLFSRSAIIIIVLVFLVGKSNAQPYSGTIFIDPDIITSEDSSAFESINYTGRGIRTVYDRRTGWIDMNAYLFDVTWNDGLTTEAQVNPEFGTVEAASTIAEKYAVITGRLPTCLRVDVDALWIHKGTEPFGGGNNSILIHTGQSAIYENDGILEETLVHEASHTSLDATHASATGWINAQTLDGTFISTYARDNPEREDIAESFLPWLAVRYRSDRISEDDYNTIVQTIPNRLQYFDDIDFDMFPVSVVTNCEKMENQLGNKLLIYPNPSEGLFYMEHDQDFTRIRVWSLTGIQILDIPYESNRMLDLMTYPEGIYIIELNDGNKSILARVIKK
ncbi:MAG: T9SS type A sorting domain-containing protein [Bacteroidota bacterium]|nr:T9SS type A sorting domain-containing protein [Bacteroidota bacterium]